MSERSVLYLGIGVRLFGALFFVLAAGFVLFFDCAGTPFGVMLFSGVGFVFNPAFTAARKRR